MEKRSSFNIPIAKPSFFGGELELIQKALESGWVSQGPQVKEFEKAVAKYVGCKQAVAVTSCTTGLHLAFLIHGIGPDDEVICPSFSFVASSNSIVHAGATPQFCDVEENTFNLDPAKVREFIDSEYDKDLTNKNTGKKLKAILLVHQIGIPADIDEFNKIAEQYGLIVVEDSACVIGSHYRNKPVGSSNNIGVLSFHPRKVITTGEGGMLLTNDEELAEQARVLRAHGASISALERHKSKSTVYERYEHVGYNYRMTDMQAAIGIKQIENLEKIVEKRIDIATRYNEAFKSSSVFSVLEMPEYATRWNYQSYPLILKAGLEDKREQVMEELHDQGIATRRGIPPIHQEPAYESFNSLKLPVTESLSDRVIFLPIFMAQTDEEIEHVIKSITACESKLLAMSV